MIEQEESRPHWLTFVLISIDDMERRSIIKPPARLATSKIASFIELDNIPKPKLILANTEDDTKLVGLQWDGPDKRGVLIIPHWHEGLLAARVIYKDPHNQSDFVSTTPIQCVRGTVKMVFPNAEPAEAPPVHEADKASLSMIHALNLFGPCSLAEVERRTGRPQSSVFQGVQSMLFHGWASWDESSHRVDITDKGREWIGRHPVKRRKSK